MELWNQLENQMRATSSPITKILGFGNTEWARYNFLFLALIPSMFGLEMKRSIRLTQHVRRLLRVYRNKNRLKRLSFGVAFFFFGWRETEWAIVFRRRAAGGYKNPSFK